MPDFVCLYNYEFWLSLCKIVQSSVIFLLPLFLTLNPDIGVPNLDYDMHDPDYEPVESFKIAENLEKRTVSIGCILKILEEWISPKFKRKNSDTVKSEGEFYHRLVPILAI